MFEWASWESSNDIFLELYAAWEDLEDITRSYEIEKLLRESYLKDKTFLQHKIHKLEQTIIALDGVNSELRSRIDKLGK